MIFAFGLLVFVSLTIGAPLLFLWSSGENLDQVSLLLPQTLVNTGLLACCVVGGSALLGSGLAFLQTFVAHPGSRLLHSLTFLPLAIPPYVLAFIYSGSRMGWGLDLWFPLQGEIGFLILLLILSLTPYVYFLMVLALQGLRQSEWETEILLGGGRLRFFQYAIWSRVKWPLFAATLLVLFEALADFGAASVVNIRVMTTLIYKAWFDLFSFATAARLSFYFAVFILLFLCLEAIAKVLRPETLSENSEPLRPPLRGIWSPFAVLFRSLYLIFALVLPVSQLLVWAVSKSQTISTFLSPLLVTLGLGFTVGILVVGISLLLCFWLRSETRWGEQYVTFSTFAYGMPGTLLAVGFYGVLTFLTNELSYLTLMGGLLIALSLKFLSIGLRPISQSLFSFPSALEEMSAVLGVGLFKRWRFQFWPLLKPSVLVAFLMVAVEVMKEMPLTLMMAPSESPTLAIRVYTLTTEAKWAEASIPALLIILMGGTSVLWLEKQSRGL